MRSLTSRPSTSVFTRPSASTGDTRYGNTPCRSVIASGRLLTGFMTRHGVGPDLGPIIVEYQGRIFRHRGPDAFEKLVVELRRSPAGVSESDQALPRALAQADVAQDLRPACKRNAPIDVHVVVAVIVGAVQNKADLRIERAG